MSQPHFASALSADPDSVTAERTVLAELEAELEGAVPDLVAVFATHHHGPALEDLGQRIRRSTGAEVVIGCTAESVIGSSGEIEGRPGLALWAARLPGTAVRFFQVDAFAGPNGQPDFTGMPPVGEPERSSVLLLADPFTFPADEYLGRLNGRFPGVPVMGGMASGAMGPGQTLFFTAGGVRESGAVGVVLEGGIELRPVVSQGCRPVGKPWVITACEPSCIQKLGGRPALEVLVETWQSLCSADRERVQAAPLIGLAIDAAQTRLDRGDFLVRSIIGLHQRDRAIRVADFVRRGQTIQLLVRDPVAAGEDLRHLLATRAGTPEPPPPRTMGALIFSCNGRGSRMFDRPDHDIGCVHEGLRAELPVAGFFANGEIGPVGGQNFLHGFTASVAVFRPPTR